MKKKQASTQLNAGENTEELYKGDSAEMHYLKTKNDKIELFLASWKQFSNVLRLWDWNTLNDIYDCVHEVCNNHEEAKYESSSSMPMPSRIKGFTDADLIKEVNENISELIFKIEESSLQNDLNEMLRLDESPPLEGI